MYDLKGVIEVIVAYPVHIMSFVGCVLLLGLVLPKRRRDRKQMSLFAETPTDKRPGTLTQDEKRQLAERIQHNTTDNLKKSFAGKSSPIYTTLVMIGMISLFFVFVLFVLPKL